MIGKVKTGKSFGGCIRYNLQEREATILYAEGIRADSISHIISDFNMQRKMKPELGQSVGHIVLSWSARDKGKLTPLAMVEHAQEYLQNMKITDTQYLVVQHHDREHPHIHIVYNRVNNQAKTISDQYQRKRNVEVCKQLTLKYGYYMAEGKAQVNRHRLMGADKVKYELYDAIRKTASEAGSWPELESRLKQLGIGMHYKYKSGTAEIQGISFSKGKLKFKGSEIDRSLSYAKLNQRMERNQHHANQKQQMRRTTQQGKTEWQWSGARYKPYHPDLLENLLRPLNDNEPEDPLLLKRKKKSHRRHL
jgi:hypothetical protein